jgi:hypothetical protein
MGIREGWGIATNQLAALGRHALTPHDFQGDANINPVVHFEMLYDD